MASPLRDLSKLLSINSSALALAGTPKKNQFDRAFLVTTSDQMAGATNQDLIICFDWLLANSTPTKNCIYYEYGLLDGELREKNETIESATLASLESVFGNVLYFRAVNILPTILHEATLFNISLNRVYHSVLKIIQLFGIRELIIRGVQVEMQIFSRTDALDLINFICTKRNITMVNQISEEGFDEFKTSQELTYGLGYINKKNKQQNTVDVKRIIYRFLDIYRGVSGKTRFTKSKYFIFAGNRMSFKLYQEFRSLDNFIFPFVMLKKTPRVCFDFLKRPWAYFIGVDGTVKTRHVDEANSLRRSITNIEFPRGLDGILARYVKTLLDTSLLESILADIDYFSVLLRRNNINSVVLDSYRSQKANILGQLAKINRLRVFYIPHCVYTPIKAHPNLDSTRGFVTDVLAWGSQTIDVLRLSGFSGRAHRSGCPFYSTPVVANLDRRKLSSRKSFKEISVLVLQYTPRNDDVCGLNLNQYAYILEISRALKEEGVESFDLKLHPGVHKVDYYEKVLANLGISARVFKLEPLGSLLVNYDLVIGPSGSGAEAETLILGLPHYAVELFPQGRAVDRCVYRDLTSCLSDMRSGVIMADSRLDYYCDVWDAQAVYAALVE